MSTETKIIMGIFAFFAIGILLFAGPYIANVLSPDPPKPVVRYGEFPFRLEYEVDGERFVVEDTIICEFDGITVDMSGKYLEWNMRLLSGNVLTSFGGLYRLTGALEWTSHGVVKLIYDINNTAGSIFCDIGNPQYYLGYNILPGYSPGIVFNVSPEIIEDDTLWNQYQIKIIKAEFPQPMAGNGIVIKAPW